MNVVYALANIVATNLFLLWGGTKIEEDPHLHSKTAILGRTSGKEHTKTREQGPHMPHKDIS